MNRGFVGQRHHPQVPAIQLRNCGPKPPSIRLLGFRMDGVFDDVDAPLPLDVRPLSQDLIQEVAGELVVERGVPAFPARWPGVPPTTSQKYSRD